jgi:hypothetical protein
MNALRTMNVVRSFSVVAALCLAGAAYAQGVDYGMQVKSPSGDVLGTVASIVPGHATIENSVIE